MRSDYVVENFKVAEFMLEQRGVDRGSIVTGSFVHNCHVERSCGELFFLARTFSCLEDNELLDPPNELHLFALHYTFISEGNLSPIQLYTDGMLENEHSGYAAVASVFDACNRHDYGLTPLPLSLWKKKTIRK